MFTIAFSLCWWVRTKAPRMKPQTSTQEQVAAPPAKKIRGYRTKMFPSMEQARSSAEKKLAQLYPEKMLVTKYESSGDGWLFYYETEKYLNSSHPADKASNNTPIFVRKDGTAEYWSEDSKDKH
jgi:hypothetical protein